MLGQIRLYSQIYKNHSFIKLYNQDENRLQFSLILQRSYHYIKCICYYLSLSLVEYLGCFKVFIIKQLY